MNQQIVLGKANIHPSDPEQDCLAVTLVPVAHICLGLDFVKNCMVCGKSHSRVGAFLESSR